MPTDVVYARHIGDTFGRALGKDLPGFGFVLGLDRMMISRSTGALQFVRMDVGVRSLLSLLCGWVLLASAIAAALRRYELQQFVVSGLIVVLVASKLLEQLAPHL